MLRSLALPLAVATLLAATACASLEGDDATPSAPGTSPSEQPAPSESGAGTPTADASPDPSAAADAGSTEHDVAGSTQAAARLDPGSPGLPRSSGASVDDVLRLGAIATWMDRPDVIALSLPASSSCWALAAPPVVESSSRILVHVEQPQPCDAADAARTYAIAVPSGVDTARELEIEVQGLEHEFTLTLPAD